MWFILPRNVSSFLLFFRVPCPPRRFLLSCWPLLSTPTPWSEDGGTFADEECGDGASWNHGVASCVAPFVCHLVPRVLLPLAIYCPHIVSSRVTRMACSNEPTVLFRGCLCPFASAIHVGFVLLGSVVSIARVPFVRHTVPRLLEGNIVSGDVVALLVLPSTLDSFCILQVGSWCANTLQSVLSLGIPSSSNGYHSQRWALGSIVALGISRCLGDPTRLSAPSRKGSAFDRVRRFRDMACYSALFSVVSFVSRCLTLFCLFTLFV